MASPETSPIYVSPARIPLRMLASPFHTTVSTMKTLIKIAAISVGWFAFGSSQAQTISDSTSCQTFGGQWSTQTGQPARYGVCHISSRVTVPVGQTLALAPSVDLQVNFGGRLVNQGRIDLPNAASIIVFQGILHNEGTLTLDNRASILYNRGWIYNWGEIFSEGDIMVSNTFVDSKGVHECFQNYGTLHLFDGGNLHSRGCVDTLGSGTLILDRQSHFRNRPGAMFRGGQRDVIHGHFENSHIAYAELRNVRVSGIGRISNDGRIRVALGDFVIEPEGTVINSENGTIEFDSSTLRVDGLLRMTGGFLDDRALRNVHVGRNGMIVLENAARAWNFGNPIVVDNQGGIGVGCKSHWRPTQRHNGYPVQLSICPRYPINPLPRPLPWLN